MRAMDFKTMLVTGLALWSIVQSVFTWYPLQNYFSFWSVVFLLIIGWFLLPFLDRERRKFSRQDIKCWRWRIEFRNWRNTTSKCWKNEAEQAIFEERTYQTQLLSNDDEKNVRINSVNIELESMNFGM